MSAVPRLKDAVWERDGEDLLLMADRREMLVIEDPGGEVEALLSLLAEGGRTIEEVAGALAYKFPGTSMEEASEGIAGLDGIGLVEDTAPLGLLDQHQRERFHSNLKFFQSFATLDKRADAMQHRLVSSHVLVLGTGGLGSNVIMHLAGMGVGRVSMLEPDLVEAKNFARQYLYRHQDIGRPKVDRAAEWVHEYDPTIQITSHAGTIDSSDDVAKLLPGVDLVVSAIDTPFLEVGSWVNRACVAARVPFIAGSMGVQSQYFSIDPGRSACLDCDLDTQRAQETMSGEAGARWRLFRRLDTVNRGVGPVAGQIGALIAMEALRYLTGFTAPVAAAVLHSFDLSTGAEETLRPWAKRHDCSVCPTVGTA